MKRTLAIWLLLMAMLTVTAPATQTVKLNLEKALELGLEKNNTYRISRSQVRQYRFKLTQNLGFLPQISIEGNKNLDEKLMVIEMPPMIPGGEPQKLSLDFTMNYEFTFQIVQPVFTGGKIWHNFRNAKIDLDLAKEKRNNTRESLILDIRKTFNNILVLRELLQVHEEALKLAQKNLTNVEKKYELGMVSKYDLLRAQLNMRSVKPNITSVKRVLEITLSNLKKMTGIEDNVNVEISGELTYEKKSYDMSRMVQWALQNRSEIRQLDMQAKKAGNLLKIAYAQFIPNFNIVARYSYRANRFNVKSDNWDDYYTINLNISFPIFTGLKRSAQVGELKVMKKILNIQKDELNKNTEIQIKNLCMTLEQEYENIELGKKNIEAATEGVRIAQLNYAEGIISILELNSSTNAMTRARAGFLQAVYNYISAEAELEKITGVKLDGGVK